MICERCFMRSATRHLREIGTAGVVEHHFCTECFGPLLAGTGAAAKHQQDLADNAAFERWWTDHLPQSERLSRWLNARLGFLAGVKYAREQLAVPQAPGPSSTDVREVMRRASDDEWRGTPRT